MTRLVFRYTPSDAVDFDVCAGPPRPEPPPMVNEPPPPPPVAAKRVPEPAEG